MSVSAVCSYNEGINPKRWPENHPLPSVFVNVFPQNDVLTVIMGYCIDCSTDELQRYVRRWEENQGKDVTELLSDLVTRIETWSMASSTYKSIPKQNVEKYLKYFVESMDVTAKIEPFDINLFERN
jgi:predicted AAA+ superfamily ATPase